MSAGAARLIAALLAALAAFWVAGCASLAGPDALRVNVVGVEPLAGEGLELRFAVKLRVQNPNDIALAFDGVAVDLELGGRGLASGVSDASGEVPRFGETVLVVPVSIPAYAVLRQVLAFTDGSRREEIAYALSGKLGSGTLGGVRFSSSGTLKLPR